MSTTKEVLYPTPGERTRLHVTRYGTSWGQGDYKGTGAERRETRYVEAIQRQAKRNARTDQEQLDLLVRRGHGHCAEAVALRTSIEEAA